MTFLPIVDRELRVAARRRGTHWVRLLVALFAILTGLVIFLVNFGAPPQILGQNIFLGLSILCMIYCVLSGRISTADCLSEEKREGTLGLLFLTDLKGYDIVLGKLVSTSLGGLYGLLAVLPVLALPLLMGGVTNGEFWRVVLVLVNTFLFSLAIGIFSSAISFDARRAMAANFAWLLFLVVALPLGLLGFLFLIQGAMQPGTLISCPFYSFYFCEDIRYKAHPDQFWLSACIIAAQTFLLLAVASWIIPRSWEDKLPAPVRSAKKTSWRGFWHAWSFGRHAKLAPYRKRLLDVNAFYWLAARARLKPLHVWTFLGLMAFWWVRGWMDAGTLWFDPVTGITLALIFNCTLKAWIALEAGQQLAEDQKAGALELLLPTPLTERDILRGQFLALRRQFLKPLLVIIAVELILMTADLRHSANRKPELYLWLAGITMLVADVLTLPVVAMRIALTAKNPARAVLSAVSRVLVLPWILFGLGAGIANLWAGLFPPFNQAYDFPGRATYLGLWFGAGIAVDLVFGLSAWRQLLGHFRELATWRFASPPSRAARRLARRQAPSAPRFSAGKKALLAGTALGLLIACALFAARKSEPVFPPPLVVSMTRSNAPLRVFPGWSTTFMILPDGSLWRWGGIGTPGQMRERIVVPERVGTNDDWLQVSDSGFNGVGLHKDGTLWQWAGLATKHFVEGGQVDSAHDWVSVSTGSQHCIALKKDGTLWAWGQNYVNQLGNGPGTNSDIPIQVGSEAGWSGVLCQQNYTLGLRTNGTLWIWGQTWSQQTGSKNFPTPTLVCRETNWTSLSEGFGMWLWARTASGEVWQLTPAFADPLATASAIGQLLASNSLPGHLVAAYVGQPELYELRGNGTLWEKPFSPSPLFTAAPDEKWRQVGKRSDWQAIWSGGNYTAFGLTADGTLWMWGIDPSRDGTWIFSMRLAMLQARIKEMFASGPGRGTANYGTPPAIQKTPRPLLRLLNAH